MKNKLILTSLGLGSVSTLLGIISTTGISEARDSLRAFHFGSTALFLGLMAFLVLLAAKAWKE